MSTKADRTRLQKLCGPLHRKAPLSFEDSLWLFRQALAYAELRESIHEALRGHGRITKR